MHFSLKKGIQLNIKSFRFFPYTSYKVQFFLLKYDHCPYMLYVSMSTMIIQEVFKLILPNKNQCLNIQIVCRLIGSFYKVNSFTAN